MILVQGIYPESTLRRNMQGHEDSERGSGGTLLSCSVVSLEPSFAPIYKCGLL